MRQNTNNTTFPIDLVYLWVNGADEEFIKQKKYWQEKLGIPDNNDNAASRFIDNDELRYSLRSVAKNAPWINKIYIITNGQVPDWLDTSHPKIKIITHEEIMPQEVLPTFNSGMIEAYIANIPGLSEHFLLANDDCFISGEVKPDFFFTADGIPIVRFLSFNNWDESAKRSVYISTVYYTIMLLKNKYTNLPVENCIPHHNIDAYLKSAYNECIDQFSEEFAKLSTHRFRDEAIQRIVFSLYLIAVKHSPMRIVKKRLFGLGYVESLWMNIGNPGDILEKIARRKPKLLCINDEPYVKSSDREDVGHVYKLLFPNKQDWEKYDVSDKSGDEIKIKKIKGTLVLRLLKNIFSVRNEDNGTAKHVIITVLGIKLTIKKHLVEK